MCKHITKGIVRFIKKLCNDDIFASSAQLSYYLILAFFPFLIFVITFIGYLNLDFIEIIYGLENIFPQEVHNLVTSTINQVINTRNSDILWFSLFSTLIAASTGFRGVIKAINKSYGVKETRLFPIVWLISVVSVVILATAIILTLVLLVFGKSIGVFVFTKLGFGDKFLYYWCNFRDVIAVTSIIIFIACIYKFAPAYKPKWSEVLIGSIVSSIGWLIVSYAFSLYINVRNNFTMLYGGLSAMFALIIWLYLTSFVFILGMEVNSVFSIKRKQQNITIKNN